MPPATLEPDEHAEPTDDDLRRLRVGEGLSIAELAGGSASAFRRSSSLRSAAGIRRVPNPARRAGFTELGDQAAAAFRAEVGRLYVDEGQTVRAIAARTGVDQRTVWRQLAAAGIPWRPPGAGPPGDPGAGAATPLRYVTGDLSVAEIARRLGVNTTLVQRILDRHGIARRTAGPIPEGQLVDLYVRQGLGIRAVARTLGRSVRRVRDDLDRYGIPRRTPGRQPQSGQGVARGRFA